MIVETLIEEAMRIADEMPTPENDVQAGSPVVSVG
jgi:(E)-4-hydroxy-3-methylbut-2-enyl-diphosphate synthase